MKSNGDNLGVFTKMLIWFGLFTLVILCPLILQIGQLFHTQWATYISVSGFIIVYLLIAVLAWRVLKPNFTVPQFKKFTSSEINSVFKTYGLILAMNFVFNGLMTLIYKTSNTENQQNINHLLSYNNVVLVAFSLSAVFIAPFVEEFIFRGIVINYFFKNKAWWVNIILSGFLFSLGHASENPISFALYATMGIVLAYTYKKSGQIKMSIAVHMLNNGVAMVFTILGIIFAK